MEMNKIAIIGAGTMGHSLSMAFALAGCKVMLNDLTEAALFKAKDLIASNLDTLAKAGMFDPSRRSEVLEQNITYTVNMGEAVAEAEMALETVFENAGVKKETFANLEKLAPVDTILASNTSYLDIYKFVELEHPERLIIAHFFAPPHIMPLVEIVPGPDTAPEVTERVKKILLEIGKEPIVLHKFLPGFIGNRLQAAMNLELLYLLDNGYAEPEDIDKAAKAGFGLRLPILGLVKRMDFAGLDLIQMALANKSYQPPEVRGRADILDELVAAGRLGVKSGKGFYDYQEVSTAEVMRERDLKLIKLKAFLDKL